MKALLLTLLATSMATAAPAAEQFKAGDVVCYVGEIGRASCRERV